MRLLRALLLVAGVVLAAAVVWTLTRDRPLEETASDEEHFKYGSLGSEPGGTLLHPVGGLLPPASIFKVLPRVCTNVVTRTGESSFGAVTSYERDFGLIYEPIPGRAEKRDLPVGISQRRRLGGEMLGVNCALCHAGTVRTAAAAEARVIPGMPPQQVDVQRLFRFIFDCIGSSEFTAPSVIKQIQDAEGRKLSWLESARYLLLIPRIRGQVLDFDAKIGILTTNRVEASGPGRLDTINPGKALELGWDLPSWLGSAQRDELIATADFPSAWNLAAREQPGFRMHWDGNFGTVKETLFSAALAVGAKPQTLDRARFDQIAHYLRTLKPPPYPYPTDDALAAAGAEVFAAACAECHTRRVGQVTPSDQLGTDPFRVNAFTPLYASQLQVALNQNYAKSPFTFRHIQKTGGYANVPLDGIWARAPYLHNGSVPTLRDLLQPEPCRPLRFHRGSDVYDPVNVGFVSYVELPSHPECQQRPDAHRPGMTFAEAPPDARLFVFDTRRPGNRNTGHPWGTDLTAEQKQQLLEFLKRQ
jgi:hypothetical protein